MDFMEELLGAWENMHALIKICVNLISKCEENMTNEISKFLKINKNIYNLYDENSNIKITDNWIRMAKTNKTLQQYSLKFEIIIENETINFKNF